MFYYSNKIYIFFLPICGSECCIFLSCLSLCRFWFFKFAALVGLSVAAFYIPDQPFTYCKAKSFADCCCLGRWQHNNKFCVYLFVTVWFIVGSAGAFFFILIQLVLLVDFAHSWNESWVEKMEKGNASVWYIGEQLNLRKCYVSIDTDKCCFFFKLVLLALLSTTVFNYILSFTAIVLLLFFYAKPDGCLTNKVFITVNTGLCVAVSIISVLQRVQVEFSFSDKGLIVRNVF